MELLVVAVLGGFIGLLLRYLMPGREHSGILLLPAVGMMTSAVIWTLLFINGFTPDQGWIWTITLGGTFLVVLLIAQIVRTVRPDGDRKRLEKLLASSKA